MIPGRVQWDWRQIRSEAFAVTSSSSFSNPRQNRKSPRVRQDRADPDTSKMDKILGLREILALDPSSSFARYGLAMELASRGDTAAALAEFDALLASDPNYRWLLHGRANACWRRQKARSD